MINPQTTSALPEEWHVQSYEDLPLGAGIFPDLNGHDSGSDLLEVSIPYIYILVCIYIYILVYISIYTYTSIYIYIYISVYIYI